MLICKCGHGEVDHMLLEPRACIKHSALRAARAVPPRYTMNGDLVEQPTFCLCGQPWPCQNHIQVNCTCKRFDPIPMKPYSREPRTVWQRAWRLIKLSFLRDLRYPDTLDW